ncbi:MAG: hypothetical protein DMG68_04280 [Acidobacteria bacterium]|nr:MAG: hypothetical protein DMG68_04280 [Acidobacteriota bacterium]
MSPKSSRCSAAFGFATRCIVFLALFTTLTYASDRGGIQVSGNLPPATALTPYNAVLTVTGGQSPYRFAVSAGRLPNGLGLDPLTGSITGAAMVPGTFGFTVAVSDHTGAHGQKALLLLVGGSKPGEIKVAVSPSNGSVSSGGTQQFAATVTGTSQTAVTWSASSGTVTGSGLFTAPVVQSNTNVTVTATSVTNPASKGSASLTVTAPSGPPPTLSVTTTVLPGATTGSAYVASLSAAGGTLPYQWSLSGTLPAGIQFNTANATLSGTTSQQGQFSVTAKVTDAASATASQSLTLVVSTQGTGAYDGPAELPRVYVQSTLANTPAPGSIIYVPAGSSLQAALNIANCGDTISLAAGATFSGIFTFPAKPCDSQHWIIVRTGAPDTALPPEGTRITPCYAGVASLPGRPPFNCSSTQNVMAQLINPTQGDGPVVFAPGAHYYRLLGLEVTRTANGKIVYALATPTTGRVYDHVVFDRMWIHGTAQDETAHGVRLAFITDMHCVAISGACTDSQAVSGGAGSNPMGPYKIVNNFLEAAAENILFGGGPATLTPADIEIRRNHLFKPMTWMKGQPGYVGGANGNPFIVKNLFELKNGQRVLFEANIMENAWGGFSQTGFGVLLTPKNQTSGTANLCPLCQVTDVTIRYSTLSHVAGGFQIANAVSGTGGAPLDGERYSIHDVTVDDINGPKYGGNGVFARVSMGGNGVPILRNVQLNHLTGFASSTMLGVGILPGGVQMSNIVITNSIMTAGGYPVWSTGGTNNCAYGNKPMPVFNSCFNPYVFAKNVVISLPANSPVSLWPTGNFFATSTTAIGFVNYNNGIGGDYRLLPTSPYHNAASDGKDIGADVTAINAAISGVY